MDRRKGIGLLVLVLVLVVAFFVLKPILSENKKAGMNTEGTHVKEEAGMNTEENNAEEGKMNIEGTDIDGEKVDSEILKENELTMVNIWGTFCKPCTEEMPELEELSKELKEEGIGLIGIVLDGGDSEENTKLTKIILEKSNVTFKNVIPSEEMQEKCLEDIEGFPTTVFLDKEGNIVGESVLVSVGKEEFKKAALKSLDILRKGK